ncbi:MAG: hypothetical protein MJ188_01420 [Treponema sp.]|nr:hypothetical protein [Treponema sp.]
MKKNISIILFELLLAFSFVCTSCTAEINLKLNKDGSVSCYFSGAAGVAFKKLICSASGVEDGEIAFDTEEIAYELEKNGFADVEAVTKTGTDITISMVDLKRSSTLFTSGIVSTEGTASNLKLKLNFTAKNLMKFYDSSDEEIVTFLDMLLAPVFNEEEMTEAEYIETISAFYGDDAGKEIKEALVEINLQDTAGKTSMTMIPLTSLLTIK